MRNIIKKKGAIDIVTFVIVIVALLFLAPIMLKIVNEALGGFSTALNTTSPLASERVTSIHGTFTTFWDWLIAIGFLVNVVLLFLFSFMVDTHPIFLVFYIISAIVIMMFAPYTIEPLKQILGMSEFSTEALQLPLTNFMISKFNIIIFSLIIVSGIILYAKFRSRSLDL